MNKKFFSFKFGWLFYFFPNQRLKNNIPQNPHHHHCYYGEHLSLPSIIAGSIGRIGLIADSAHIAAIWWVASVCAGGVAASGRIAARRRIARSAWIRRIRRSRCVCDGCHVSRHHTLIGPSLTPKEVPGLEAGVIVLQQYGVRIPGQTQ